MIEVKNIKFGIHDVLTQEQEQLKIKIATSKYKKTQSGVYSEGDFKWYSCCNEPFRFVREYEEFGYGQPSFRYEDVIAVSDILEDLL